MSQNPLALLLVLLLLEAGCTTFRLTEQEGVLPVQKQRRASDATLFVAPFPYAPADPEDSDDLSPDDLASWQHLLVGGLDQANIFARVEAAPEGGPTASAGYVLRGRLKSFRFQKNWVPTFFPLHLALSFFTFTGFTFLGGPTTATIVRFSAEFQLEQADTGERIAVFEETYRSTRAVNIYSKGVNNPYDNPNLVFARIIGSAATRIAAALPE